MGFMPVKEALGALGEQKGVSISQGKVDQDMTEKRRWIRIGAVTSELHCEVYVEIGVNHGKKGYDNASSETGEGEDESLYRCLSALVIGD